MGGNVGDGLAFRSCDRESLVLVRRVPAKLAKAYPTPSAQKIIVSEQRHAPTLPQCAKPDPIEVTNLEIAAPAQPLRDARLGSRRDC